MTSSTILRRHIALPQDHGSWVFLLSPLLIGMFAGETWSAAGIWLVICAMAAFLIRQPVTIVTKVWSKRRSKGDLPAAHFWTTVYAVLGLVGYIGLYILDFGFLAILALPGIPVFIWHLWLVSRRSERRQLGVELVGSGVLALAAPAAYWAGVETIAPTGWMLWVLTWAQSAASIVHAYLRLEQRNLPPTQSLQNRLMLARRALLYTTFNLVFVALLGTFGMVSFTLTLPYLMQWGETLYGALRPASGARPTQVGIRQLIVSMLFTILFILAW
jgi:hypothetical protein